VTIRRIATDVGVTGAALCAHFPGRGALLEALCRSYLEGLMRQMIDAEEAPRGATGRRRLTAYFEFALAHPEVYRLAFAPLAATRLQAAGGSAEARAIWALLSVDFRQAPAPADARPTAESAAWLAGAAHGIALLLTSTADAGIGAAWSPGELAERLAWMVEASSDAARRTAATMVATTAAGA